MSMSSILELDLDCDLNCSASNMCSWYESQPDVQEMHILKNV